MKRAVLIGLVVLAVVLAAPIAVGAASHSPALDGLIEGFKANLALYIAYLGAL